MSEEKEETENTVPETETKTEEVKSAEENSQSDYSIFEDEEEEELVAPEHENEAKEVNVGNIMAAFLIGILVIFLIAFIAVSSKSKNKNQPESDELDKAGTKTVIEFKDNNPVNYSSTNTESGLPYVTEGNSILDKDEKEIEEALGALPKELQLPSQGEPGRAPVSSVGTGNRNSTSTENDRPDTKSSKSTRKIEGLAALNFTQQKSPSEIISSVFNGTYNNGNANTMSKEDYITQQLQKQGYGSLLNQNGDNRQSFFDSTAENAGNGSYLSKTALWDGTIISGALVTAINTDNPGVVIARVTENVYSSQDHSFLLIPEGSLLMATYNSSVNYGQNSVQVAWNLLIRPDNYRIQLGNMNGVTAQGASGYKGSVSNHPWETLKALGLIAVYSFIQTEVTNDINALKNEYVKNMMTDVYAQASNLGNKIVDKALDIKPTIKVKEGTEIKLITNVPLELPPVQVNKPTQKYVRTK